jgi:TRAP-type C4-dicarboxylate transport system permease small subunit
VVAVVVLVCMMMFTVTDVCLRYFFNNPITASDETTEFMMIIVGFLGLGWCALKGMHIKVHVIVGRFSERTQAIFDTINNIIVLGVCAFIASQLWRETLVVRAAGKASDLTNIPYYPFYFIAGFGYFLLFLIMISLLVRSITGARKR